MTRSAMSRRALFALFPVLAAACASGPSGPPPFDPVGTYSYSAGMDGMTMSGTMAIEGTEGAYSGSLQSEMGAVPITSVVVMGQAVTIEGSGPQGPLTLEFVVTDGAFMGTWAMGGMGGSFTGSKTN